LVAGALRFAVATVNRAGGLGAVLLVAGALRFAVATVNRAGGFGAAALRRARACW